MVAIIFGMILLGVRSGAGREGDGSETAGFWISWLIHIVEALYGIKLCQSISFLTHFVFCYRAKGITDPAVQFQWFVQTLLFGYASFGLLVSYKPADKKQY
ncbi:hypothetical protein EK904_005828 [Melospiza melodia maxima]|nr:hypothetical protein EK904_005828 [Melospiza melodia maxima]